MKQNVSNQIPKSEGNNFAAKQMLEKTKKELEGDTTSMIHYIHIEKK